MSFTPSSLSVSPATTMRRGLRRPTVFLALAAVIGWTIVTPTTPAHAATAPVPACDASGECTVTYDYTGALQEWIVPDNVYTANMALQGAQGGTAADGAVGGLGAQVNIGFATSPGSTYQIIAGAHPVHGQTTIYGGGGQDGSYGHRPCNQAGPGGGATSLLSATGDLLAIAGGGGGGGGHGYGSSSGQGGTGGHSGSTGMTGERITGDFDGYAEGGGPGVGGDAGGAGGVGGMGTYDSDQPDNRVYGSPGAPLQGGGALGGGARDCDNLAGAGGHGGGGGGGYLGGGGGGAGGELINGLIIHGGGGGGGGGGSSHVAFGVIGETTDGAHAGPGQVTISYHQRQHTDVYAYGSPDTATVDEAVTLTSYVTYHPHEVLTGTVSFYEGQTLVGSGPVTPSPGVFYTTEDLPVGTHTLTAVYSGNDFYQPSTSPSFQVEIIPASQTISFTSTAPSDAAVDGPSYTPTATGGRSGNPVTFTIDPASAEVCELTGGTVSFRAQGTCTVNANQAGTPSYTAASQASQSIAVDAGSQNVTFTSTAPSDAVVDGPTYTPTATGNASGAPIDFAITPDSGDVCTIADGVVSFIGAGICTVDAKQPGNDDYAVGSAQQDIAVGKATQTIRFTSPAPSPAAAVVGGTHTLTALGGTSGLPVDFSVHPDSIGVCTLAGDTLSFTGEGTCTVNATQAGTDDHHATQTQHHIVVGSAPVVLPPPSTNGPVTVAPPVITMPPATQAPVVPTRVLPAPSTASVMNMAPPSVTRLARTGAPLGILLGMGAGLLALGGASVGIARRRTN